MHEAHNLLAAGMGAGALIGLYLIWYMIMGKFGGQSWTAYAGLICMVGASLALGFSLGEFGDYSELNADAGDKLGSFVESGSYGGIALFVAMAFLALGLLLTLLAKCSMKPKA